MLKLATWNINSLRVRLPQLIDWLALQQPDIIGLQELKLSDHEFPNEEISKLGYEVVCYGQKSYNGVAILSKTPISEVTLGIPDFEDNQARVVSATISGVRFISVYAPNGQSIGSDKFHYKLAWFSALKNYLTNTLLKYPHVAIVGDFNVAPEDRDVHDPTRWAGHILVSPQERQALQQILDVGFIDSFRLFEQPPRSFSWWDYRAFAFERNEGLRIDHILVSASMAVCCGGSVIDRSLRGNERPSDHTVVMSEFYL